MTTRTSSLRAWVTCWLIGAVTPAVAFGETHKAAELTPEALAAAIDAAKDGDTVELPAGKAVWTRGWNTGRWAKMKAITIKGAGIDQTIIADQRPKGLSGDTPFDLKGVEGKPFRLTGVTIDGTGCQTVGLNFMLEISGNCKNFRVDHCRFKNAIAMIRIAGDTHGLIDHCEFEATEAKPGLVQTVWCQGPGFDHYDAPLSLGTAHAIFFEDNEVRYGPDVVNPTGNNPWIVPYGGARVVIRYNKIVNTQLEVYRPGHGELPGCKSAEIYNNAFSAVGLKPGRPQCFISISGGVNIVFNNTVTGTSYNESKIALSNPRAEVDVPGYPKGDGRQPRDGNQIPAGRPGAGYPLFGQVGWANVDGHFVLSPCYAWNNTINGRPLRMEVHRNAKTGELATLQEGREFFNEQPPGEYYAPYVYPHPLQASDAQ